MGILDKLGLSRGERITATARKLGITSPYSERTELPTVVVTDLLSAEMQAKLPVSRDLAMTVPAVSKARNLLVATIAPLPLVAMTKDKRSPEQPAFLTRTGTGVTVYERMAWTVDDLLFYGCSLWAVKRGDRSNDARRPILSAEWVPQSEWCIDEDGTILVYDEPARPDDYIIFNSPFEGLLKLGARTIRGAVDLETAWTARAASPVPIIELKLIDDQLTQTEVDEYVDKWAKARKNPNGAIGATPPSIELKTHGELPVNLYGEGRNAVRTDIGSFTNIRASMLDGTIGVDSLTYTTKDGERNQFYEIDLPFWTDYIESRLSEDDVLPAGQRMAYDKSAQTNQPIPTGTPRED